jgi:hypothetical protein
MPVKSLDSGQTIVRQKTRISPSYCTGNKPQNTCSAQKGVFLHAIVQVIYSKFSKKLFVVASNLLYILLPELEIWSDISQSINLQKCIHFVSSFDT